MDHAVSRRSSRPPFAQLPGRAARDFNLSGSLKGTVAMTLKVRASPLILNGSNCQARTAVSAASFNAGQFDLITPASVTDPEGATVRSTITHPSSPAESDSAG
jgi:hypothetical protein